MKDNLLLVKYWLEIQYIKILHLFHIKDDPSCIPEGMYCYEPDIERNKNKDENDFSYYIKPCKYYRWTYKTNGIGCTYLGFFGFDVCLYDQCKLCNINLNDEED